MTNNEVPTKTVPIDSISPHPENYNMHPDSQIDELAESDQSFGQYRNVVIWSPDSEIDIGNGQKLYPDVKYILAGNGYWLGRRRAGRDTIEVKDYTGIPYEDALLLMKVDNAAPLGAQPDSDKLKTLLKKTKGRMADVPRLGAMIARLQMAAGPGFSPDDIEIAPPRDADNEEGNMVFCPNCGVEFEA